MDMAALITKLYSTTLAWFIWVTVSVLGQNLLSCDNASLDASGYRCSGTQPREQCGTFAVLFTNSYYSSLFNLSFYLGINQFVVAEVNGFSADTQLLPKDQPLLIPIDCRCNGSFFGAELTKTTTAGETLYGIAESLGGLTTCRAIKEKNPAAPSWVLGDQLQLVIPLRCACPPSSVIDPEARLLLSYPVREGDTVTNLAIKFNTTPQAILSANNRASANFIPESLVPSSSLLIPLKGVPLLGPPLSKPRDPNFYLPGSHKRKRKMWEIGLYFALGGITVGAAIAVAVAFLVIHLRRKNQNLEKSGDVELQQLSLSVRSVSDKKVSFEGSQQDPLDGQIIDTTQRKMLLESYTVEELRRATEDFNSCNNIAGSVYHGRLNGKNIAIKRVEPDFISKIEFRLLQDAIHHHPNIIRLLGTCVSEDSDSYLVFEYAKNGSLKDWLHGGLAIKSQFISSCYCFLTWNQRLKICLDVAVGLQYMHHIMNPPYVHRNIKSRNIFLDEEFNARIGNFGMARCSENEKEEDDLESDSPNRDSWNQGCLAPEYVRQGIITPAIDIFAFGVVLLEVLSGQTPITRPIEKAQGSGRLSEKIKSIMQSENGDELRDWMDSALGESYSFDAAVAVANLARACAEEDLSLRPSAGDIVERLSRLAEESPEGEQHTFLTESSSKPLVKAGASSLQ